MGLKDDMQLDDQMVKQYFQDIEDFVTCLEKLHPHQLPKDIKTKLKQVRNINFQHYNEEGPGRTRCPF